MKQITAWTAESGKGKYTSVQKIYFDTAMHGTNGTMDFQMTMGEVGGFRNCHFEVEFTVPGAIGVMGLFSTGISAEV